MRRQQTRGSSPLDLDPLAFEALVRDLLLSMGYQATLTKASHDGGIDIEAVNPQPIVGGRVIVQCKRYSGTVGASYVRDLFGAVMHTRASKGVLVTTSDFSPDAIRFAEGKPLDLIHGQQLAELLNRQAVEVSKVEGGLPPGELMLDAAAQSGSTHERGDGLSTAVKAFPPGLSGCASVSDPALLIGDDAGPPCTQRQTPSGVTGQRADQPAERHHGVLDGTGWRLGRAARRQSSTPLS